MTIPSSSQSRPLQAAVLLYPGCIFFEIALAAETLAAHMPVRYITPDGLDHAGSNGATVRADGDLQHLQHTDFRVVLVPGGDPHSMLVPEAVAGVALQAQTQRGAVVAGICAGNLVLAQAGLLKGRRATHNYTSEFATSEAVEATRRYWEGMQYVDADWVQDGSVITAQPWAYRAYAAAVARSAGVIDEDEARFLRDYVDIRSNRGRRAELPDP